METGKNWKIINDKNKKTLRISSFESGRNVFKGVEKLPFDIEIFQNLVDNICRKFDIENGENLLCFGGCAIFNRDGTLKCVENFLPKYPSLIKNWLTINNSILAGFLDSREEKLSLTDPEIRKNLWESVLESGVGGTCNIDKVKIDRSFDSNDSNETHFSVVIPPREEVGPDQRSVATSPLVSPTSSHPLAASQVSQVPPDTTGCSPPASPSCSEDNVTSPVEPKKSKTKFKVKQGVPVPPKPVLCLSQDQVKDWFPVFLEKLSGKKFPTSAPKKFYDWDVDVDKVLTIKDFVDIGPKSDLNWARVSANFYWKLKLVSAIILDKRGLDYTTFAENVEEKHEKYSVNDLKLMSMSKNPETFEKLFMKNMSHGKKGSKPSYLDDFEKKSSEIILQNFRLINARDKKLNGNVQKIHKDHNPQKQGSNVVQKSRKSDQQPPMLVPINPMPTHPPLSPNVSSTRPVMDLSIKSIIPEQTAPTDYSMTRPKADTKTEICKNPTLERMNEISTQSNLVGNSKTSPEGSFESQELEPPKSKRKKSAETTKDSKVSNQPTKEAKVTNQRFLCKNTFQKGDFLIHPSQLNGQYGPVKLVTSRRETKKVFLSISEFETVSTEGDLVFLERSSHKNRSTPAKFLDSYLKINNDIRIIEKNAEKMRIRRLIPKNNSSTPPSSSSPCEGVPELIDKDDTSVEEAIDNDLENEMVIDETD